MRLSPVIKRALRTPFRIEHTLPGTTVAEPEVLDALRCALDPANRPARAKPSRGERVWTPRPGSIGSAARVMLRHPALARIDGIPNVPLMRVGRSSRSIDRGIQGRFHSMKTARTLRSASNGEFDVMLLHELTPDVSYFCEQPVWLEYSVDGRIARHKPDLLVVRGGSVELVEVRPERSARKPENELRWKAIGLAVAAMGLTFRVLTEVETKAEPRWRNVRRVWRDRLATPPDKDTTAAMREVLRARGPMTVDDLAALFASVDPRVVHSMVRRGLLLGHLDQERIVVGAPSPGQVYPTRPGLA